LEGRCNAPDLSDEEITATLGNSAAWLWGKDKAIVVLFVDLIGGLPCGEFDVDIPLSTLSPFHGRRCGGAMRMRPLLSILQLTATCEASQGSDSRRP
jgi:hypothetical protein